MAISGDGNVEFFAGDGAQVRELPDKINQAFAQKRFASGDADFLDTQHDKHANHTQIFFQLQIGVLCALVASSTIDTAIVAPIGDGDSQIGNCASELVVQ